MALVVGVTRIRKSDGGQVQQLVAGIEDDQRAAVGADQVAGGAQNIVPGRFGVGQVMHGVDRAPQNNLMLGHGVPPTLVQT
ncbi:hypothetical protein G6F62_014645 [Rhizopus arrhizus]|nr:hypothetical protein G6F35_017919 [Rhizopus arrhizus]KAG1241453.1 hypothetical protein G6F65_023466 [Rhizopus arrhizus]KAG1310318.1 hypothetical protein G6F62_014645 [Rhizopus arrhizus]